MPSVPPAPPPPLHQFITITIINRENVDADLLLAIGWIYAMILRGLIPLPVFTRVSISTQSTESWEVHAGIILHIA